MAEGSPEFNGPISIQTHLVLSGGCLAKPQVVEPVEEVDETLFCKVSNTTPWFTLFVTGCPFSQRPLGISRLTELVREKLREHELRLTMRGQAVSALGLDDEQEDAPNHRFSRLARKRRKQSKVSDPIVTLQLPIGKESADTKDIQILNKSMKDVVWLKLDCSWKCFASSCFSRVLRCPRREMFWDIVFGSSSTEFEICAVLGLAGRKRPRRRNSLVSE